MLKLVTMSSLFETSAIAYTLVFDLTLKIVNMFFVAYLNILNVHVHTK